MIYELKTLIEKLNPTCKKALEGAAGLCVQGTNYTIEVEHFLMKLIELPNSDVAHIFTAFKVNMENVRKELKISIDRFKRGNNRTPNLSPIIQDVLQKAWATSTLQLNSNVIRSGSVIMGMVEDDDLRNIIIHSIPSLIVLNRETMRQKVLNIIKGSSEDPNGGKVDATTAGGTATLDRAYSAPSADSALGQFTVDLTEQARQGLIDPIYGRDVEIRQVIDILTRRRQNNPILTGEAGVGKTAVVEGLAQRIVKGDVPPPMRNVSLRTLDLGLLQAGAGMKGEFENRLKNVINEVKESPIPVILFIDEAHTMIGAGGQSGQNDAANLLKPALARGELRTIAATTWSEYKKYFEKDPALTRRFQVVKVEEPSEEVATTMLRGLVPNLRHHHKVLILDEAVKDAIKLSSRYISEKKLPDKAISVLDTACARVAVGQNSTPPQIEEKIAAMERIQNELNVLEKEQLALRGHTSRITELQEELDKVSEERHSIETKWSKELEIVKKLSETQNKIEQISETDPDNETELSALRKEIEYNKDYLETIQAGEAMVPAWVDSDLVASVVSSWTGIPVGKMLSDEIASVLSLEVKMAERIVGQPQALESICRRIHISRADLTDPNKPVGVFLLVGPSGVGKTETAITLTDIFFGGERNLILINMSEYQEAHTVSLLKGAPPGYVGYGKGGVLTEAVRRNPYSVVLLDEVEKAHPDVLEIFYQIFDKGRIEDSEGIEVDFKNTIILLTSNVGSETIIDLCRIAENRPNPDTVIENIRPELVEIFKPALLGRMTLVPFYPLGIEEIRNIVALKLTKIQNQFQLNHNAKLTFDVSIINRITENCTQVDTGARTIDNFLNYDILPELSRRILEKMAEASNFWAVNVTENENQELLITFTP